MAHPLKYIFIALSICTCSLPGNEESYHCAVLLNDIEITRFSNMPEQQNIKYESHPAGMTMLLSEAGLINDRLKISFLYASSGLTAIVILGTDNRQEIDKIACALFNAAADQLPRDISLLFKNMDHLTGKTELIAALKRKYYR